VFKKSGDIRQQGTFPCIGSAFGSVNGTVLGQVKIAEKPTK
jgi:hypothetical protein